MRSPSAWTGTGKAAFCEEPFLPSLLGSIHPSSHHVIRWREGERERRQWKGWKTNKPWTKNERIPEQEWGRFGAESSSARPEGKLNAWPTINRVLKRLMILHLSRFMWKRGMSLSFKFPPLPPQFFVRRIAPICLDYVCNDNEGGALSSLVALRKWWLCLFFQQPQDIEVYRVAISWKSENYESPNDFFFQNDALHSREQPVSMTRLACLLWLLCRNYIPRIFM